MKQIIPGTRGYNRNSDLKRALAMLKKRGFNYFVRYRDTQSEFALLYSIAAWVPQGQIYIDW